MPVMLPGSFGAWKALTVIAFGVLAGLGTLFDLRYTISVLLPLLPPLLRPPDPPVQAWLYSVNLNPEAMRDPTACSNNARTHRQ